MTIAIRIAIIIIITIIIISIYKVSISLTVLGTLQYHKKCYSIKTASISKKIRCKSINQRKVWWNKYRQKWCHKIGESKQSV